MMTFFFPCTPTAACVSHASCTFVDTCQCLRQERRRGPDSDRFGQSSFVSTYHGGLASFRLDVASNGTKEHQTSPRAEAV